MSVNGKIHIQCSAGMHISINEVDAGISTLSEKGKFIDDIAPGFHFLEIKKAGYATRKVKVQVKARQVSQVIIQEEIRKMKSTQHGEPVEVIEESLIQQTGSLKIITIPAYCEIELMGETFQKNKNEIIFEDIPVGNKIINFSTSEKKLQCNISIEDNKTKELAINFIMDKILTPAGELKFDKHELRADQSFEQEHETSKPLNPTAEEELSRYEDEFSSLQSIKEFEPMLNHIGTVEELPVVFHEAKTESEKIQHKKDQPVQLTFKDFPRSFNKDSSDKLGNKFFNNQTVTIFITGTNTETSYYTSFKLTNEAESLIFDKNVSQPEYSVSDDDINIMLKEGSYRVAMRFEQKEERKKSYVIECRVKNAVAGEKIIIVPDGNSELKILKRALLKLAV